MNGIREIALRKYKELFPKAVGLVEGDPGIAEPQKVLDGPKIFMEKNNAIVKEWEGLSWEYNKSRQKELEKQWEKITKEEIK